ncbi:MAG: hypothetical protein IPG89_09940 [Bacteroidetes bacterium]|nr:hypothetical protein [Bacteroidota bacterium]
MIKFLILLFTLPICLCAQKLSFHLEYAGKYSKFQLKDNFYEYKLKIRNFRLGYEYPIHLPNSSEYLSVNTAVSVPFFKFIEKDFRTDGNVGGKWQSLGSNRDIVLEDFKKQLSNFGPYLNLNLGMSYNYSSRMQVYSNLGRSFYEFRGTKTYFIDKVYLHQFGLRYKMVEKLYVYDQYKKRYLVDLKENNNKKFLLGIYFGYDLSNIIKQEGKQVYNFNGYDGNNEYYEYSEYLYGKPVLKTFPVFGLNFTKLFKQKFINWKADVNYQFMNVTYSKAVAEKGYSTAYAGGIVDEKNQESRMMITTGPEMIFLSGKKLNIFFSATGGLNLFYYAGVFGLETQHHKNYDNFNSTAFVYKLNSGVQYNKFRIGGEFSSIPKQFNNFGEYKLSGFNQIRIFINYNFYTKIKNEKI